MTRRRTSLLLLGTLGAGLIAGRLSHEREQVSAADPGMRDVLYYVDPMHPAYTSDKPGTAPDCGMALVPVHAHDAVRVGADHKVGVHGSERDLPPGAVHIEPHGQQLIGVRVSPVEHQPITERLRLPGRVAADEARLHRINLGLAGIIRELSTAATGSRVRRGESLATISVPDVRPLLQAHIVALEAVDRAPKDVEPPIQFGLATASLQQSVERLLTLGISSVQIEEIARTRQVPPALTITAPHDGVIVARNVSTGQMIMRGEELFRIADLRRVWVLADVFGRDAEYLRPGMAVEVSLPDRPRKFRGVISRDMTPQVDATTPSAQVRLEVDNPDLILRPGMFVDVEVAIELPPALVVPTDAVIDSGLRTTVFVQRSAGVFEPVEVQTGWRAGGYVEIVGGLAAGDPVVVSGTFLLDSETRMRHVTPESRPGHDRPHH